MSTMMTNLRSMTSVRLHDTLHHNTEITGIYRVSGSQSLLHIQIQNHPTTTSTKLLWAQLQQANCADSAIRATTTQPTQTTHRVSINIVPQHNTLEARTITHVTHMTRTALAESLRENSGAQQWRRSLLVCRFLGVAAGHSDPAELSATSSLRLVKQFMNIFGIFRIMRSLLTLFMDTTILFVSIRLYSSVRCVGKGLTERKQYLRSNIVGTSSPVRARIRSVVSLVSI